MGGTPALGARPVQLANDLGGKRFQKGLGRFGGDVYLGKDVLFAALFAYHQIFWCDAGASSKPHGSLGGLALCVKGDGSCRTAFDSGDGLGF